MSLNKALLCILEVVAVLRVSCVSWIFRVLDSPVVHLIEMLVWGSPKSLSRWQLDPFAVLFIDGLGSWLCVRFTEYVLWLHIRHISLVSRDVLCFYIVGRPSYPVLSVAWSITELDFLRHFVLRRWLWIELSLCIWFLLVHCYVNIEVRWLVPLSSQYTINISLGASVYFVLLRHVACIPW